MNWYGLLITWNFLKVVFHKFHLVHTSILCPIFSYLIFCCFTCLKPCEINFKIRETRKIFAILQLEPIDNYYFKRKKFFQIIQIQKFCFQSFRIRTILHWTNSSITLGPLTGSSKLLLNYSKLCHRCSNRF